MNDDTLEALSTPIREEQVPEEDLLISRLIDGAASDAERMRFETLAEANTMLWRELACRHQDMSGLREQVRMATAGAGDVDLPRRWFVPPRVSWTMAMSGWAAVLIVMVSWAALALVPRTGRGPTAERVSATRSPEELYQEYLSAPYVLDDMPPEVTAVDPMSDGRIAVRFVRKSEEVLFVDPHGEMPLDERGELLRDLRKFREQPASN